MVNSLQLEAPACFALMATPVHRGLVYRFGLFEVSAEQRELFKQGRRIKLQDQPFKFLLLLLEQPGEVVSRESVRQHLWSEDTFVAFDQSLGTAITKLRQALGDNADNPRFIETVPRRGYRFIAPVTVLNSGDVVELVPAAAADSPVAAQVEVQVSSTKKSAKGWWMGAGLVLAAALLAGILLVRLFEHAHSTYALSDSDTVVLADFVNKSGDQAFDDTLKQALSVSLSQSPFLNILPDRRVGETLKLMGRSPNEKITGETALEVCQRTGSAAVLGGSITRLGTQYVIGLDATNCQTGAVFAREQVQAPRKEEVLNALGGAGTRLRQKLGESLSTIEKFDVPLEQATTPSFEALKAYSTGLKLRNESRPADALPFLKHAIELDPNFAMAYGILSGLYQALGEDGLGSDYAQKAYDLRARTTERENFAVTTYYYNFVRGDREKALANCKLWAETYPRDLTPHICLFFDTEMIGQYKRALPQGLQCVEAEPDAGLCYDDLIYTYAVLNRLEEAKAIYQQGLAHKLDEPDLHGSRYGVAFVEGDTAEMNRQLAWAAATPGGEDVLLPAQSDTEAFYGRFARARELNERAVESAMRDDQKERAARLQIEAALREALVGNAALARRQTTAALGAASFEYLRSVAAITLALAGDANQAEKIGSDLDKAYPADTMLHAFWLPATYAAIEIQRNRAAKAIASLQPAVAFEMGEHIPLLPAYLRGQAYLAARQGQEAAAEFQKILDHRGLMQNSLLGALSHLGLGRAYALELQSDEGDNQVLRTKARTAYQNFLALWKDADPDLPILKQAKAEGAGLK